MKTFADEVCSQRNCFDGDIDAISYIEISRNIQKASLKFAILKSILFPVFEYFLPSLVIW